MNPAAETQQRAERQEKLVAVRLKDSRVLIVSNLLNGLPVWQVARDYHVSAADVEATFKFVMNKVKNYVFKLCKPPISCDTIDEAKKDRVNILAILPKLNLDKEPEYARIVNEKVTDRNYKKAINDNIRRKS